jgi:hypothetical protein
VNPSSEALLVGNFQQQTHECVALLIANAGEQSVLVLSRHLTDFFQDLTAAPCEVNRVQATVSGVCSPLHQSSFLKVVQYGDQPARMNLQLGCKLLLA